MWASIAKACAFLGCLAVTSAHDLALSVYNTTQTPVQIVRDPISKALTFNVHLYILAGAGDPHVVAQGGAFFRWSDDEQWQPAPAPLYDEHQVDPVVTGTTRRGYNIAFVQPLKTSSPPSQSMQFRIWALTAEMSKPVEIRASAPVIFVPDLAQDSQELSVELFKQVAYSSNDIDGVHVHLVINVWPPQPPTPPDYQLFADVSAGDLGWQITDAPSRFEHTYDAVEAKGSSKTHSRYNLSWRLAPGMSTQHVCSDGKQAPPPLKIRVRALSFDGAQGSLELPSLEIACISSPHVVQV